MNKYYCPYCKCYLQSTQIREYKEDDYIFDQDNFPVYNCGESKYTIVKCGKCDKVFFQIDSYNEGGHHTFNDSFPKQPDNKFFSAELTSISPTFVETFNQALYAKDLELDQIVGVSLRKALEFLIKDFLSHVMPEKAEEIKRDVSLSNVINNRIPKSEEFLSLEGLKQISIRAWWLGSDHTHYYVKYQTQDVEDLITCINLTVSEIELYLKKKLVIKSIKK